MTTWKIRITDKGDKFFASLACELKFFGPGMYGEDILYGRRTDSGLTIPLSCSMSTVAGQESPGAYQDRFQAEALRIQCRKRPGPHSGHQDGVSIV
jgi:hypothetical protein